MKPALLILALALSTPARADILMPGQAGVSHTFEVRRLDGSSDDTKLFVYPAYPRGDALAVEEGESFTFHKRIKPRFYAYRGELPSFPDARADPGLPHSEGTLSRTSAVPEWQATRRIHTVYALHGVEGDRVRIELVSETHYDADGGEILPRTPSHSDAWMLLPVAALLALGTRGARRGQGGGRDRA